MMNLVKRVVKDEKDKFFQTSLKIKVNDRYPNQQYPFYDIVSIVTDDPVDHGQPFENESEEGIFSSTFKDEDDEICFNESNDLELNASPQMRQIWDTITKMNVLNDSLLGNPELAFNAKVIKQQLELMLASNGNEN